MNNKGSRRSKNKPRNGFKAFTHQLLGYDLFYSLKLQFGASYINKLMFENDYYLYHDTRTGNLRISVPIKKVSFIFNRDVGNWYKEC